MRKLVIALSALCFAACQKDAPTPQQPVAPPDAVAQQQPQSGSNPQRFGGLLDRLQQEAQARPQGALTAETVLSSLEAKGLKITKKQQHLAQPFGASFCLGAELDADVALSICEYPDESSAKTGRDVNAKSFREIAHREVFVNGKTTLAVLETPAGERSSKAKETVVAVFTGQH